MNSATKTYNLMQQTISATADAAITAVSEVQKLLNDVGGSLPFHQDRLSRYDQTGYQMRELMPAVTDEMHTGQSVGYDPRHDEEVALDPTMHARVANDLHGALHLMRQKGFETAKSGIRDHLIGRHLELIDNNRSANMSEKHAGLFALHRVSNDDHIYRQMMDRTDGLEGYELHQELADMADDIIRESNYALIPDRDDLRYVDLHTQGVLSVEDLENNSDFAMAHIDAMGQVVQEFRRDERADQDADDQLSANGLEAPLMFKGQAMEIGQLNPPQDTNAKPDPAENLTQDTLDADAILKRETFSNNQPSVARPAPIAYQTVEMSPEVSDWELVKEQFLENTHEIELTYKPEVAPTSRMQPNVSGPTPPGPGLG